MPHGEFISGPLAIVTNWTIEAHQDWESYYGMDVEAELLAILSCFKIDADMIKQAIQEATIQAAI